MLLPGFLLALGGVGAGEGVPSRAFYFLPHVSVAQYFKAVNLDKREYVCPWCIGGGAQLWEWAANAQGAIFTLLLRKSDEGGGGDFYGYRKGVGEGEPIRCVRSPIAGRWGSDLVALVGDYDSSKLWDEHSSYRIISEQLVDEWNSFIELPDLQLQFRPDCSCRSDVT